MTKTILNPLHPGITPSIYEKGFGDALEKQISKPRILASLFRTSIYDTNLLKQLEVVQLIRRTKENPRWLGASGYNHQIDESFSTIDEKIILLVECKSWNQTVDFPSFSTFLVRLIDIEAKRESSTILGMMITTQGYKGRDGGREEDRSCIPKIRDQFNEMGHHIIIHVLTHQVLSDIK